MLRKHVGFWLGATVALLLLTAAPSYANQQDITVGGDLLFRVRAPAGGFTIQERIDKVHERLVTVIGDPRVNPGDIVVKKASPDYAVFIRDRMIFTIDAETAKANSTTPYRLGQKWLKTLRLQVPQY
jgi:hypothetical protein